MLDRERREAQGEEPLLPHEEMTLPQRDYTRIPGAWPYMDLTELSLREAQDQVNRALENVAEPVPSTDWPRPPENRRGFTATDRLFNEQVRQQR